MKNTFVKVLSFVMALMMVVGTFSTLAVVADECDHTKGTLVETKPATCESNGYSTYICGVCGEEWDTDVTLRDENKHNYVDVPAVEASCLTDAFSAGKQCEYCDKVLEGVKNLGGLKAHNFVGVITEATCETNKKLEYTCSICNQTAEKIAEDGEFFVEAQKKAYTEEKKWNKVEETGTALNPGHADLVWTVKTAPSQTATECLPGLAEGFCKKCEKIVRTAEIPAKHTEYELNPDGYECADYAAGVMACRVCGKILTANAQKQETAGKHENFIPVFAIWDDKDTDSTDDDTWTYDYATKVDGRDLPVKPVTGEKFTLAELTKYGYSADKTLATAPTCTTKGSALVQCECGAIFTAQIKESEHKYNTGYTYNAPEDCTQAYTKSRTCSTPNCGYKDIVVIVEATATKHNMVVVPYDKDKTIDEMSWPAQCEKTGYTYSKCENKDCMGNACGKTEMTDFVDALGHDYCTPYFKAGNDATCATADAWKTKCANCNAEVTATATIIDGWEIPECVESAEYTQDATCNDFAYTMKSCTVCQAVLSKVKVENSEKDPTNHVYPTDAELKAFVDNGTKADGISDWNGTKKSSCTEKGEILVTCKYCPIATVDTSKVVTAPLAEHTPVAGSGVIYNDNGTFKEVRKDAVEMNCTTVGYDADGQYCEDCGHEVEAATKHDIDPDKHVGVDPDDYNKSTAEKVVYTATCQTGGYVVYNTTCHGRVTVAIGDGKPAGHLYNTVYTHGAVKDDKTLGVADCINDGYHTYMGCYWCGAFEKGGMLVDPDADVLAARPCNCGLDDEEHLDLAIADDYVIPAKGHDFTVKVEGVNPLGVCSKHPDFGSDDLVAHVEYYTCKNGCGYDTYNGVVYSNSEKDQEKLDVAVAAPVHYGKYMKTFESAQKTCTSEAVIGGTYCTVCQKDQWLDKTNGKAPHNYEVFQANLRKMTIEVNTEYNEGAYETWKASIVEQNLPLLAINVTEVEEEGVVTYKVANYTYYVADELADCTKDGCLVLRCTNCDDYQLSFIKAKNDEHKYSDAEDAWEEVNAGTDELCHVDSYKVKYCEDCTTGKIEETTKEATGHYTTKGVDGGEKFFFVLTCDKVNEFKEYSCDICGVSYLTLALELNAKDSAKFHNVRRLYQDATCTEKGYEIVECKNGCNFTDDALKGLNLATATNRVIETKGETGKHTVEHAKSIELERVEPVAGVDGYVRYICGVCGKEATDTLVAHVVVDTAVAVDTTFVSSGSMIKVTVSATADAFTFYELTIKLDLNNAFKVVENSDYKVVAGTALGEFVLIDITDSEIVIYNENDENNKPVASTIDGENVELVTFYVAVKEAVSLPTYVIDTNAVSAVVGFKDDGADNVVAVDDNGTDVEIDVVSIGDLNQDGSIGRRDISMMKSYIEDFAVNGVYSAVADVNRDGSVDVVDIAALRAFVKEGQTAAAYLKLIGEDLDAALAATTAPSTIIGVTDAGDRQIVFAAAVKAAAAKFSYTDYLAICEKLGADSVVELLAAIRQVMIAEADATYPSVKITATTISVLVDDVDGNGTAGYIDIKF